MRSHRNLMGIVLMALTLLTACSHARRSGHDLTKHRAQDLLSKYVAAAVAGDSTAVREIWSRASVCRTGFWESLHISIGDMGPLSRMAEFVRDYDAKVTSVRRNEDHYIVDLDWVLKDAAGDASFPKRVPMRHYVVHEDDRFLFANPLHVLTREWHSHRGDIFRFHYPPSLANGRHLTAMKEMECLSREILDLFGDEVDGEIDIYVTPDAVECGELLLYPPAGGYACPPRNVIVSTTFVIPHELAHMLSARRGHDIFVNAAFAEGIAVGLGGTATSTARFSLIQASNIAGSDLYVPVSELISPDTERFMANAQVTYHEAGAFLKYLIDEFGLGKLDELHGGADTADEFVECIPSVYGAAVGELERRWLTHLDDMDLPKLGCDIPGDARVVFALCDAAGDDYGGGALVYPSDPRFVRGCFDLRSFEVLKDEDRAYFRLGFTELGRPVFDETSGYTYTPSTIIAVRRGDGLSRHVQTNCEGISFASDPGWDLRLDVGAAVVVRDGYNRSIFATGNVRESISNWEANTLEFSLPFDVTGAPDETWGFFVSTALMHDRGFGFLRSFPQPVGKRPSRFSFGGGRSERNPPHIDILLPDDMDQSAVLGGRGEHFGRGIVVPLLRARGMRD